MERKNLDNPPVNTVGGMLQNVNVSPKWYLDGFQRMMNTNGIVRPSEIRKLYRNFVRNPYGTFQMVNFSDPYRDVFLNYYKNDAFSRKAVRDEVEDYVREYNKDYRLNQFRNSALTLDVLSAYRPESPMSYYSADKKRGRVSSKYENSRYSGDRVKVSPPSYVGDTAFTTPIITGMSADTTNTPSMTDTTISSSKQTRQKVTKSNVNTGVNSSSRSASKSGNSLDGFADMFYLGGYFK